MFIRNISARRINFRSISQASKATPGFNLNNALDKAHESKSLKAILALPPSALQGLTTAADDFFVKLKIHNIEQLAHWKAFRVAQAVDYLSAFEVEGHGRSHATANFNGGFDKEFRHLSLKEHLALPPHSIKGLAPWVDEELADWRVKNIKDLAHWKFPRIAQEIAALAEFEDADHVNAHAH